MTRSLDMLFCGQPESVCPDRSFFPYNHWRGSKWQASRRSRVFVVQHIGIQGSPLPHATGLVGVTHGRGEVSLVANDVTAGACSTSLQRMRNTEAADCHFFAVPYPLLQPASDYPYRHSGSIY